MPWNAGDEERRRLTRKSEGDPYAALRAVVEHARTGAYEGDQLAADVLRKLGILTEQSVWIRFERGRDDVTGPLFGPFEYVQATYGAIHADRTGDGPFDLARMIEGEWFIVGEDDDEARPHSGEFYSDFVIFCSSKRQESTGHDCEAGRTTFGPNGEELVSRDLALVPTGRVWDTFDGRFVERGVCPRCGMRVVQEGRPTCSECTPRRRSR